MKIRAEKKRERDEITNQSDVKEGQRKVKKKTKGRRKKESRKNKGKRGEKEINNSNAKHRQEKQ